MVASHTSNDVHSQSVIADISERDTTMAAQIQASLAHTQTLKSKFISQHDPKPLLHQGTASKPSASGSTLQKVQSSSFQDAASTMTEGK